VLLLVGKVETEGKYLQDYLEQYFSDREIVFISGSMSMEDREFWRNKCRDPKNKLILIATYPVFQAGVDIPALGNIIFAAPFKSKIRILQSIGRALRKHITKVHGAQIYDLVDHNNKWFATHGKIRERFYHTEKFRMIESDINED
jgi:superfamily II DNA or RNA helicase